MTIVAGKIESLKKLKDVLNENGITRFNSIGEINCFLRNYESELNDIPYTVKITLDNEIKNLETVTKQAIEKSNKNIFNKIFGYLKIKSLNRNIQSLINNYENIVKMRCIESCQELEHVKSTVEGLYTLIAGAIGENSVVNELQKLPDNYYLINDFSLEFNPPIYNKRDGGRIFSIQIDHLLICQAGVFVLETKNWSVQSIKSLELRSPIEQIQRTSYALFVLLNSKANVRIARHHWGVRKIPIRSIVVMTNKSPKEEFKHVKVLPLNSLNGYIQYFDEMFTQSEVENIFNYLNNKAY